MSSPFDVVFDRKSHFPRPVSLGDCAVGWVEAEVNDWLNRQIKTSRNAQAKARGVS